MVTRYLIANPPSVEIKNRSRLKFLSTQNQRAEMTRMVFFATAFIFITSPATAQEQTPPIIKRSTPVSLETADGKYSILGCVEYFLVNEHRVSCPQEELTRQMKIVLRVDGKKLQPVLLSRLSDDSIRNLRAWQSAAWERAHQDRRLCHIRVSMEKLSASLEEYVGSNVCLRSHMIDFDIKPSKDFEGQFSTDLISSSEARFDSAQDPRPTLGAKLVAELKGQFKSSEESAPCDIFGRVIKREDKFFLMIYEINFYRSSISLFHEPLRNGTFANETGMRKLIRSFKHLDDEEFLDN